MGNSGEQSYGVGRALALGNLTTEDVTLVSMDFPTVMVAFRNGALDAGMITEPYITQAVANNSAVILVPGGEINPDWPIPLWYGPSLVDRDRILAGGSWSPTSRACDSTTRERPPGTSPSWQITPGSGPEILNQSRWYPMNGDGRVAWKPIGRFMDWLYDKKIITQKAGEDQILDMSFVSYADTVPSNTTPGINRVS